MNIFKYLVLALFFAPSAQAFLSIAESGELVPADKYQVGVAPQFLTNRGGGTNVDVFFDGLINESTSGRVSIGAGAVDFNAFASAKWIPFPDVDNQPAMGLRGGVGIFRDEGENGLMAQLAPLISKQFPTEYGMTTPYMAVALNFINSKVENYTSSNIVFGTEFQTPEVEQVNFGAELGVELSKSYSYITLFATFPFDSTKGFGK